jgi:hypothetical protein
MPFRIEKFDAGFQGFGSTVASALQQLGEPLPANPSLSMSNPIPVYAGRGSILGATVSKMVRRTGWRSIVMSNASPVALVDLPKKGAVPLRPTSIRGHDAAAAFLRVLHEADRVPGLEKTTYSLRFIVFPGLFVTALWLASRRPLFIPTRIGSHGRPLPTVYGESAFLSLLQRRHKGELRFSRKTSRRADANRTKRATTKAPIPGRRS